MAAARAVIFTSLVDDPDDKDALPAFVAACKALPGDGPNVKAKGDSPRMRLFDFIERLVTWEATTDEKIMGQARELIRIATEGKPPPLLDPFAGGGSIPLEAQRLGLEAHASDLNPVAVMINKAMIEIPPRFADKPPVNPRDRARDTGGDAAWKAAAGLAADVRYYGEWMRDRAFERIGHLYPKHEGETVIAWLWARTVISPNPAVNAPVPLVRSFVLSKKKGRKCWAKPVIEGKSVRFEITPGEPPKDQEGTVKRTGARCIVSGEPIPFDYIRAEGKAGRMGAQLMAIVTEGKRGRSYYSPEDEQVRVAESAEPKWKPAGDVPEKALGFRVQLYGMDEYHKLFTLRQLTALTTFSDLVHEARELATQDALAAMTTPQDEGGASNAASSAQDSPSLPVGARGRGMGGALDDDRPLRDGGSGARAYGEAVSVYLAFAMSRTTNRSATICIWNTLRETIEQVFGRQAIPMTWDFAEANLLSDSTGNWAGNLDWIAKVLVAMPSHALDSWAFQEDAKVSTCVGRILSTDPPYYDNIGYADLSDYFYVWMRRSLRNLFPDVFATLLVPKTSELIASAYRHGNKSQAKDYFETGMFETFSRIRRIVRRDFPLTVYYAF